jgi:hypothetical protein
MKIELNKIEAFMILEALTAMLCNCQECEEEPTIELVKKFVDELDSRIQKPQVVAAA